MSLKKGRTIFPFLAIIYMSSFLLASGETERSLEIPLNENLKSPAGKMTDRDYFMMGKELSEKNQIIEAIEILKAVREEFPKSIYIPESLFLMGKNFLIINRFREAVESFDLLLRQYPNYEKSNEAIMYLAMSLERNGQFQRAKKIFDEIRAKSMDLRGLPYDVVMSLLRTYKMAQNPDEFMELAFYVLNVIAEPKIEKEVYQLIHDFYKDNGMQRQAMKVLFGSLLLRRSSDSDYGELMKFADLWMENPGMLSIPNLLLCKGYLSPGEIYLEFAKSHPFEKESREAMYKAGVISLERGEFMGAIDTFKDLLSLTCEGPLFRKCQEGYMKGIARLLEMKGSEMGCMEIVRLYIEEIKEIEEGAPLDPDSLVRIGDCCRVMGLYDLAISLYRKSLKVKLDPQVQKRAILGLSEIYLYKKSWKECIEIIHSLEKKSLTEPLDGRILEIMGEALFQIGQFQEIIELMGPHLNQLSPKGKFWFFMALLWTNKIERREKALMDLTWNMRDWISKIEEKYLLYLGDIFFERDQMEYANLIYKTLLERKLHPSLAQWVIYRMACIGIKTGKVDDGYALSGIKDGREMDSMWSSAIKVMDKNESIMKKLGSFKNDG